jgi:hypothetical protein
VALTKARGTPNPPGIIGFHTSLAGHGEIHDRWNGRAGDFDYQTSILRLAGERGMIRQEKLFLAQNTLPIFDRLLDILDDIPLPFALLATPQVRRRRGFSARRD